MGFMPGVNSLRSERRVSTGFSGLNLSENIRDGQLSDCKNIITDNFPILTVRGQFKLVKQVEATKTFVVKATRFPDSICSVATDFLTSCDLKEYLFSGTETSFVLGRQIALSLNEDFSIVRYKKYTMLPYYNSETKSVCMQLMSSNPVATATVIIASNIEEPVNHIHLVAFKNRLLCAFGDGIYICYEDNFLCWDKFYVEGSEQGSTEINEAVCQYIPLATDGSFTACTYYKDKPIVFKERAMFALYGSYTPYSIVKIADVGCISNQSIQVIGDDMIFLSEYGLMAYSGGTPYCISEEIPGLQLEKVNGCFATDRYYYINNFVYDIKKKCFSKLDEKYIPLCSYKNRAFFFDYSTNRVVELGEDYLESGEQVEWFFKTKVFSESVAEKKKYTKIAIRLEPYNNAQVTIEYAIDGGEFKAVKQINLTGVKSETISLNIPQCDSFQLKVSGVGRVKIPFITREYRTVPGGKSQ